METRLVTAFYFENNEGVPSHPFHLHNVIARYHRYLYSIVQLSKMNLPIRLVCGDNVYDALTIELQHNNVKNVEVEVRDLDSFKYSKKIRDLKSKYPDKFNFYHEIDWAKLDLLNEESKKGADYLYWIDCGLSHRGLWPNKYAKNPKELTGFSHNIENYKFDKIFTPDFFKHINNWVGDKLINIKNRQFFHPQDQINRIFGDLGAPDGQTIGGILGGHNSKLEEFLNEFDSRADKCISDEYLLNHEGILTHMATSKPENYKSWLFTTWYHENTGGMDWITPEWLETQVSFYEFVKEIEHE